MNAPYRNDDGPSAHDVELALRARLDRLVPELLPGAIRDRSFWSAGSVGGEQGQSLKLNRSGPRAGLWTDFSAADGTDERGGDMLKLICAVKYGGWSKGAEAQSKAIAWAKDFLGWQQLDRSKVREIRRDTAKAAEAASKAAEIEAAGKLRSAKAMWHGAVPIAGTPAEDYLRGRGIDFARLGRPPGSLRYLPDCWCGIRSTVTRHKYPAMVAAIYRGPDLVGVHRTYLDVSGGKGAPVGVVKTIRIEGKVRIATIDERKSAARLKSHKLSLGDYLGGCIVLWKGGRSGSLHDMPAGTSVYVSEGIEDGLSVAFADPKLTVVAGVALANMGSLQLPPQAGPLVFIGQNDPLNSKAVEAFERAIEKQQRAARASGRPPPRHFFPRPEFKDFNDQLLGKAMA
jgi:hypothetical protein